LEASPSLAEAAERVKIRIFWAAIGPEAMKKCEEEWKFDENDKATVTAIISKIDSKLKEERIPIIDRIRFQECKRHVEEGESIFEFMERAEKLVDYCNYGEKKNELLLQQILCGMKDLEFQKELLAVKKLDWNLAKQSILARRNRDSQLDVLNPKPDPETVKKIQTDTKYKKRCQYCGTKHKKGKEHCPVYGKSCSYCNKPNHFEKVCHKKAEDDSAESREESEEEDETDRKKKKQKKKKLEKEKPKTLKRTQRNDSSDDSEIFMIRKTSNTAREITTKINLKVDSGWRSVKCHLDTGSSRNIIGIHDLKKLVKNPEIVKSTCSLRDIQNRPIKTIGECSVRDSDPICNWIHLEY
jgi:hypothetical protein